MEKRLRLIPLNSGSADYPYCERLYLQAFPPEERRAGEQQRSLTDSADNFHFQALQVDGRTVGFLTWWDFPAFIYIEHFAVDETMRGQHIGSRVLKYVRDTIDKPVILEVERPDTEIARRRIGFYERCGYTLWKSDYRQPPYQQGYDFLPLYLMCDSDVLREDKDFDFIRDTLYKEVYGLCDN